MNGQLFNRRIPTVFGIGFVILAIVLTTFIIKSQTNLKSKASNSEEPQSVKITNLSDNSFTITYQTDTATTGSVNYGQRKELGNTQLEDLPKNVHSITVEKLSPDTKYYLVIISGQNTFLNNGIPFDISTGHSISSPGASQTVIKGKVILPDGNAPNEALVYLSTDNSQILSTTAAKDGEFNFSLKGLRTNDLASYFKLEENTVFKLLAINKSLKSTVLFSLSQTNSIPTITLSNDYDFTKDYIPVASKSAESKSVSFPVTTKQESLKPQILSPKKDQAFADQKPQFRGISLPNETVTIIIHSDENIQTQVTADKLGNWTYRPPSNLSPGAHTITIKTRDSSGILTTIIQSFTVFAAETTQTPTPTTPFATPTQSILPTLIPSPTYPPTGGPSSTPIPIGSKGGLPPTGNPPSLLIIGGIAAAATGLVLFFLTRNISL